MVSEFYAFTCLVDSVYDIFVNEDKIIIKNSNVCVNTPLKYDGVKQTYLGKKTHFLKLVHLRMISGPFEIYYHEGSLLIRHRPLIFFVFTKIYCAFLLSWGLVLELINKFNNQE